MLDVQHTDGYSWPMIQSCRDKRTRDFAAGKRVKEFSGFEHAVRMKMDRMEAATSVKIFQRCQEIVLRRSRANAKGSGASESTSNGESVSSGQMAQRAPPT